MIYFFKQFDYSKYNSGEVKSCVCKSVTITVKLVGEMGNLLIKQDHCNKKSIPLFFLKNNKILKYVPRKSLLV